MDTTVVTYGGGEILTNVFNSIAILINGRDNNVIRPLLHLGASIGGFWILMHTLFKPSVEAIMLKFFFPVIVISMCLLVPTTNIKIEDVLKNTSTRVDHVPVLFAKFTELISSISYRLTTAIETVMHTPSDSNYNATGMIFGSETALDISKYAISNANLEQNLRHFSKQCVLYDIALGRYTIDDLKKADDLWNFFAQKTSTVRMIPYQPVESGGPDRKNAIASDNKIEYVNCRVAVEKMTPYFQQEINYHALTDIGKHLPLTFQALTGISKTQENLISQQLVMQVLLNEFSGNSFAKSRAQMQQRSTYQVMGFMASSSLITMRAALEALIYASFLFIIPMSVFPGGFKFISSWAWLVLWIQLWPPFYAILSYIMQSAAQGSAHSLLNGTKGLSLFTSIGLQNLQDDIFAMAGYLSASIPFISYAILKGGVSSFMHLAGSMMTPAHNAATSAAGELATGNYSFGNSSFGQMSFENTTAFQKNMAPSISSGYLTDNQGDASIIHTGDEHILKQSNSDLRTSLFSDDSISQSMQHAHHKAHSAMETSQKSYSESLSNYGKTMADLSEHLSNSKNYNEGVSYRDGNSIQDSVHSIQNMASNWGQQYGFNERESLEFLASAHAGVGVSQSFFGLVNASLESKLGVGYNTNASRDSVVNSAMNLVESSDFQKHMQAIQDFSENRSLTSLNDEGIRLSTGYMRSVDDVKSSQDSYQLAESRLQQVSDNASWSMQNANSIKRSLNQDFVNWASDKYANEGGFSKVSEMIAQNRTEEVEPLIAEFVDHIKQEQVCISSPLDFKDPNIANIPIRTIDSDKSVSEMHTEFINEASSAGLTKGDVATKGEGLFAEKEHWETHQARTNNQFLNEYGNHQSQVHQNFNRKNDETLFDRMWERPSKDENLLKQYQISQKPFWVVLEDN